MSREIDRFEVLRLVNAGAQLVEVLPRKEYQRRHIAGAINLPLAELTEMAGAELDSTQPVITYCHDALCDLSGRAAGRLESLGFAKVYNYNASKVDWFANSLPAEGTEADQPQLADLVEVDVPTCTLDEPARTVRARLGDHEVCLVVDHHQVLLGSVDATTLSPDDDRSVGTLMREGPGTHRPDMTVPEAAELVRKHPKRQLIVTNADGTVVGVADPDRILQAAKRIGSGQ